MFRRAAAYAGSPTRRAMLISAANLADKQAFNAFIHELQAVAIATECTVLILTSAQSNIIEPEHTMVDGIVELADELTGWAAAKFAANRQVPR
jgi:hypothetical protein